MAVVRAIEERDCFWGFSDGIEEETKNMHQALRQSGIRMFAFFFATDIVNAIIGCLVRSFTYSFIDITVLRCYP